MYLIAYVCTRAQYIHMSQAAVFTLYAIKVSQHTTNEIYKVTGSEHPIWTSSQVECKRAHLVEDNVHPITTQISESYSSPQDPCVAHSPLRCPQQ